MIHFLKNVCLFWITSALSLSAQQLPIYIEDSHAGSFSFFAKTLDLEKNYTLILLDAHSDASGIPGSDRIRTTLRKVSSTQQRKERIDTMRRDGTIQCFNWIEPLMPKPISKVIWIAGDSLNDQEIIEKQKEARVHLDWHTQAEMRADGLFAQHYTVTDWGRFKESIKHQELGDIVVSIDLDYFLNIPQAIQNFKEKWHFILEWEKLEAVSFALSSPWQKNQKEAEALLYTAFESAFSVQTSQIQYEPYLTDFNDRSEMVKSYLKNGQHPPRHRIDQAGLSLKKLLTRKQSRLQVTHNPLAWEALLRTWADTTENRNLEIHSVQRSTDGVWRMRHNQLDDIWLQSPDQKVTKVRWWLHKPLHNSYNIIPKSGLGKGFVEHAPAYIVSERTLITETDDLVLAARTWRKFLHSELQIGIVKIQAELVTNKGSHFTEVIEIRVRTQDGFLGALEEQFGSPYVFGIGSVKQAGASGPETLLGNDCANFLIYAFRRIGKKMPWCNPSQIKQFLEPTDELKPGDIIHLGSHVGVLYEDKGTLGSLDAEDVLVHHLAGFPEFISLKNLTNDTKITVMRMKQSEPSATITLGGDVCLHGEFKKSDVINNVMVANLECVISDNAKPWVDKKFQYIVPKKKAKVLKNFKLLSVANNHAGDGGVKGLKDTMDYLNKEDIKYVGIGTIKEATKIKTIEINDQKIGFLGLNLIECDVLPAKDSTIGIASYPTHKDEIQQSIRVARQAGVENIIALPHWGDEYTTKVNDEQRACAKWLIEHGVDIIVGSHPHRLQHHEFYQGKLIIYSMGNLIFAPQNQPGFNVQNILRLQFDEGNQLHHFKIIELDHPPSLKKIN